MAIYRTVFHRAVLQHPNPFFFHRRALSKSGSARFRFWEVTMYGLLILFFVAMFVCVVFAGKLFPRYTNYK
jgi:hypothetical protein